MRVLPQLVDGFLDLALGSSCVVCGEPGRPVCVRCAHELPVTAALREPTPSPPGLAPPYAAGDYDGALRSLVIAHKERRVLALARPLGGLLARSVKAALDDAGVTAGPVVLVPVPSRPAAVRQRGHDPTLAMTVRAAHVVSSRPPTGVGPTVTVARLLRPRPGVMDQAGLDTRGRAANLAGSMKAPGAVVRRLAGRVPHAHLIVCDDVITTGATLREAQRALEVAGVSVLATASVAATRRRDRGPEFDTALS